MNSSESIHSGKSDIYRKISPLQAGYLVILALLFFLIVFTPYLIKSNFSLRESLVLEEEVIEGLLIALLLGLGFLIPTIYKKELNKYLKRMDELATSKSNLESRLDDAFKYIGEVNVQLLEIRSAFSALKKYPENQKDFARILCFFAQKVLGIVNADWVMFRIVNKENLRTLREYSEARATRTISLKHCISNRALVGNKTVDTYSVVASDQENLTIKVFCVLPTEKLTANQHPLIKAIVTEIEMLFIILTSQYYREIYLKDTLLNKPPF